LSLRMLARAVTNDAADKAAVALLP